ncbi:tyrosine-protein kinase receptor Tie-2 [Strongylocentrotus purpuratus]|uniref:Fibronectin type-III domain-containing protein n=1 Tax=Strongylocentrotus purpuratus TaxID=7668 RepID=A0A7M7NB69_STRPU|nr:tyrosine-protein kinase receptor Tie-2 [Strongylocentrotus purpuratus]
MCEVVHITVVTLGYYTSLGSSHCQLQCYRSEPDRNASLSFGRSAPITTDRSPPEDVQHSSGNPFLRVVRFPTGDGWDRDGFGPFYCEASKSDRDVTRVTTFFQRNNAKFITSDGLFTKTVNVNDTGVTITMTRRYDPDVSDNAITWRKDGSEVLTSFVGQTQISFPNPIQTSDQGFYEIYYNNERHQSRGGLYRLIVRECPAGKWGPPGCYGICNKCYNGGVCDDKSGLCICPNNFKGPNCLEICSIGTYGPGCSQTCHCANSSCNIFSGICAGGCQTGWFGDNCQIPDECEDGYFGAQCTDKCHCLYDEPCGKDTGECPEQKCALGYHIRSGHVRCQECEGGTFGLDCLQECHCAPEACEAQRGLCKGQCLDTWIEPYCQRISRLVTVRVNPYQPSKFTCYVEGNPLPDASSVDLYRRTGSTNNRTGITRRSSTVSGSERAIVFHVDSVYPQEYGEYVFFLSVENTGYPSMPYTSATYVLPVITTAPVVASATSTIVVLRWDAWSEGDDIGDPPLVGYNVFVKKDGGDWVTDQRVDQLKTSAFVINLTPDTGYMFRIAAVREGTGGTGPLSPRNSIITHCRKPSASPTGLQVAAINPKELEVTWEHLLSELADCRSGVTHYTIYYASTGSTSSNSILVFRDTSSYTIRGLDTYLDYTIQLTASNKDEEGDKSSETIGKTIEEVAPAPINVTIPKSTTSSFTVSWSTPLPSNTNGNIQKYIIRYQQTDPIVDGDYKMEEVFTGAFDGEHTVMNLPREINYTVQVRTVNGAGSSHWSEPVNAKTISGKSMNRMKLVLL